MSDQLTVLVTGGAGYIGSHAVLALQHAGYNVVILDNLSYGHRDLVEQVLKTELIVGDTNDRPLLDQIFATHNIAAVMHFAADGTQHSSHRARSVYWRSTHFGGQQQQS